MNNEPVAWMLTLPDGTHDWILDGNNCEGYIPLYTNPAKTLTPVTDEEIKERVKNTINGDWADGYYDGVRWAEERLGKAQEK